MFLTYGSEIFGFENLELLEKIHTDFLKKITKCRRSTPSYIIYAELGRYPLEITIKSRIIGFWNRILLNKFSKFSYILYQALKTTQNITSKWVLNVKKILCEIGRNDLWIHQAEISSKTIRFLVKQILEDQYIQSWRSEMEKADSSKSKHYDYIKDNFELEPYFKILPKHLYLNMIHFRSSNHKLPIEVGRWNKKDHKDRKCNMCDMNTVGDELHYLLECPLFLDERKKYIAPNFYRRPNMLKYKLLMSCREKTKLKKT